MATKCLFAGLALEQLMINIQIQTYYHTNYNLKKKKKIHIYIYTYVKIQYSVITSSEVEIMSKGQKCQKHDSAYNAKLTKFLQIWRLQRPPSMGWSWPRDMKGQPQYCLASTWHRVSRCRRGWRPWGGHSCTFLLEGCLPSTSTSKRSKYQISCVCVELKEGKLFS